MPLNIGIIIISIAFFAEYMDSALGMGYGTLLTPLLLLMGFNPLEVVPAVLLSEFITGMMAGLTHHKAGNVDLAPRSRNLIFILKKIKELGYIRSFKKGIPLHLKIALLLAICSVVGTVSAVFIAVNLPKFWLKLYIGCLISVIGAGILFTVNKKYQFSWKKITILGLIASFNKGLSGGGYGPVVTGGQLLSGVETKSVIGITSLAEGLTCLVAIIIYLITVPHLDLKIAPYNIIGAMLSVPFAVYTVKKLNIKAMRVTIGIITLVLGFLTIIETIF